jgi:hypothetical protein
MIFFMSGGRQSGRFPEFEKIRCLQRRSPVSVFVTASLHESRRGLIQCDPAAAECFQFVIEKAVFAAALEADNGKTMMADLVDSDFLTCAFDADAIANGNLIFNDHLYSPLEKDCRLRPLKHGLTIQT